MTPENNRRLAELFAEASRIYASAAEAAPTVAEPAPVTPAPERLSGMLGLAIPDGELLAGGNAWLDRIAALGAKTVRFDVRMETIARDGWANTDRLVEGLTSRGIKPLMLLNAQARSVNAQTGRSNFRTFATAAVNRYKDRTNWWEILNESNHTTLTPAQYADLLKVVYPAIKAEQPDSVVIYVGNASIPSTTGPNVQGAEDYLRRVYAAGGRAFFDAVAHHPYQYPLMFSRMDGWTGHGVMRAIRAVMNANGDNAKRIWITEAGAPTAGGGQAVTEADQATTLRQLADLVRQAPDEYGPIFWYAFQDRSSGSTTETFFGLFAADGRAKPAAAEFQRLASA